MARNISLSHVPEGIDICVCTDLDELFLPGWRESLEKAWGEKNDEVVKGGRYLYNWSLNPNGTPGVQMIYSKVHERNGFQWEYPIHEYVKYIGNQPLKEIYIDGMILNHYPDIEKSRGNYLPLLECAVSENPTDDRMVHYLGREYMYMGKWQSCIDTLRKHLILPTSQWNEERGASMHWIAYSYYELGDYNEATAWYFRAMAEVPHMREPYIEFARMMYELEDWAMVYYLVQEALKIEKKSDTYINMEYTWDYTPYDLGAIACYHLGLFENSLLYEENALELCSDDERLVSNYQIINMAAREKL